MDYTLRSSPSPQLPNSRLGLPLFSGYAPLPGSRPANLAARAARTGRVLAGAAIRAGPGHPRAFPARVEAGRYRAGDPVSAARWSEMPDLKEIGTLLEVYARWGARYLVFFDRPNTRAAGRHPAGCSRTWSSVSWTASCRWRTWRMQVGSDAGVSTPRTRWQLLGYGFPAQRAAGHPAPQAGSASAEPGACQRMPGQAALRVAGLGRRRPGTLAAGAPIPVPRRTARTSAVSASSTGTWPLRAACCTQTAR